MIADQRMLSDAPLSPDRTTIAMAKQVGIFSAIFEETQFVAGSDCRKTSHPGIKIRGQLDA